MCLKSTEHTLCIYCDFVLRSEWSLINIPGTMGLGPKKLPVVKGFNVIHVTRNVTWERELCYYLCETVF